MTRTGVARAPSPANGSTWGQPPPAACPQRSRRSGRVMLGGDSLPAACIPVEAPAFRPLNPPAPVPPGEGTASAVPQSPANDSGALAPEVKNYGPPRGGPLINLVPFVVTWFVNPPAPALRLPACGDSSESARPAG